MEKQCRPTDTTPICWWGKKSAALESTTINILTLQAGREINDSLTRAVELSHRDCFTTPIGPSYWLAPITQQTCRSNGLKTCKKNPFRTRAKTINQSINQLKDVISKFVHSFHSTKILAGLKILQQIMSRNIQEKWRISPYCLKEEETTLAIRQHIHQEPRGATAGFSSLL